MTDAFPVLDRDGVDAELAAVRDARDRINAELLELEAQPGYRMLLGAPVEGATARARAEVRAGVAELWDWFGRYARVVDAAGELRARRSRPDRAELAELSRLLLGRSVEPPAREVPLERRTLLAAPPPNHTLATVVDRMTDLYEDAVRRVADVDAAWSALLPALERAEQAGRDAAALPEAAAPLAELAALAAAVRADPLTALRDGLPRLTRVHDALAGLRERARAEARARAELGDRLAALDAAVALVRDAEDEARRVRAEVAAKVAAPPPPDVPALAVALADRCAAVRRAGDAPGLADRVAALEAAAADALRRVRESRDLAAGLLDRREELRGRLDAYRMKAARLGHAEDADLAELHERARALLWSAPCDLRRATAALSGYQQAITARAKGPDR
ncbi:hypothetical protein [Actinomadura atramentaria]|uniref:hypothetical protein n=1 Tax=Actinomadura atramentaria TaxID=1990 RepID=UPI000378A4E9|nr:hypothetical protein [Actinomadura atramentaria]